MITGRPKKPVILSEEVREQLGAIVNSRSSPHGLVRRAHIVLLAADGISNNVIAERVGISHQMVCHWRKRYLQQGLAGLHDELRPGRPRSISDEEVATLVRKTLETKPRDGTHWTVRTVAKDSELSRTTVHRIWQAFGLQPHRQRYFKLSTDPFFVEKVRDILDSTSIHRTKR
jgi:putative transposase